jgi:AcrR family transcriptional regulator
VPRLWSETIEDHRHAVREATLDAAAALVAEVGVTGVTMSKLAVRTGIGRATLYKYFPDIESVLTAWHERHIAEHLQMLIHTRDGAAAGRRLPAVLQAYADLSQARPGGELTVLLHNGPHVAGADRQVHRLVAELIAQGAAAGDLRQDVPAAELATFCLHALTAAGGYSSKAAVHRLVNLTLTGLRPGPDDTLEVNVGATRASHPRPGHR